MTEEAQLASKCLDLCQMLAGKNLPFTFSMKVGTNKFELPFEFQNGDIKIAIQQRNPRRIGYLVYSKIEFQ